MREWVAVGIGTTGGTTCTNGWNYTHTIYRSFPIAGMEQTRGAVLFITSKGIQLHECHCLHACDPTHSAHSLRRRQEASSTGTVCLFWQFDAHGHQHTLGDYHRHYASIFFQSGRTQEDHAHAIRWFRRRSHISASRCNEGKSSL